MGGSLEGIEHGDHDVTYLTVDDVVRLYARTFGWSLRQASKRLHNRFAFEGVLERLECSAQDQPIDLPHQGAILARGIIDTQPFAEGNRPIALIALLAFLELNGCTVTAGQEEWMAWMSAPGDEMPVEHLAERIRSHVISRWE